MKIGVVVPCNNEGEYVNMTIRAVADSIADTEHDVRMAWVDDCSYDDSAARAMEQTSALPWAKVVRLGGS